MSIAKFRFTRKLRSQLPVAVLAGFATLSAAVLAVLSLPSAGLAGGTSSGGGELLMDRDNPWFLGNMREVRYCAEIDQANFGTGIAEAEAAIESALAYWKKEFEAARPWAQTYENLPPMFGVGSQVFTKETCKGTTDLRFQLGVLRETEASRLGDPRRYVAGAVREEYDAKSMRGRGFIYVAPTRGRLRPVSPDMLPTPWTVDEGIRLVHVLVHELGHVFGVPHSGARMALTGAGYPEFVVSAKGPRVDADRFFWTMPGYFLYNGAARESYAMCTSPEFFPRTTKAFFGLPGPTTTVFARLEGRVLEIYSSDSTKCVDYDRRTLTGTVSFEGKPVLRLGEFLTLYVPEGQRAFPAAPKWMGRYPNLVGRYSQTWKGKYRSSDGGVERVVSVTVAPNGRLEGVSGILDGELILDAIVGR